MKIVFLDIDGVLNHATTRSDVLPNGTEPLPIPIAPECMARLNRLIAETGAKIVISSSWRNFARWQDLGPALVRHGLVADVIGETPNLPNDEVWLANWQAKKGEAFSFERLERGWEIAEWIAHHADLCATCAHPKDMHDGSADACFHNDTPSGATGCTCPSFRGDRLAGFVILDDCSDMDVLKPWLVLTHPCDGLDDPDVERAKWLLDRSADGFAAARAIALGFTNGESP
jgi:hypothetical protein